MDRTKKNNGKTIQLKLMFIAQSTPGRFAAFTDSNDPLEARPGVRQYIWKHFRPCSASRLRQSHVIACSIYVRITCHCI